MQSLSKLPTTSKDIYSKGGIHLVQSNYSQVPKKPKYLQELDYLVTCEICQTPMPKFDMQLHDNDCPRAQISCEHCDTPLPRCELPPHLKTCAKYFQYQKRPKLPRRALIYNVMSACNEYTQGRCVWCQSPNKTPTDLHAKHLIQCKSRKEVADANQQQDLTFLQARAMFQIYRSTASSHMQKTPSVTQVMNKLGYSSQDMAIMRRYLQLQAPIVIHIKFGDIIKSLNKDCSYRSLFQTNTSNGSKSTDSRKQWEKNLFGQFYSRCEGYERIKYGVLNYANCIQGVEECKAYGNSILVLKNSVRPRCTFCDTRKYQTGETVSTLRYHNAVLSLFLPEELRILHHASKGFKVNYPVGAKRIKEIHIHGPILMFRDVEFIVTSEQERQAFRADVEVFEKRFKVRVISFEEMKKKGNLLVDPFPKEG